MKKQRNSFQKVKEKLKDKQKETAIGEKINSNKEKKQYIQHTEKKQYIAI